MAQVVVTVCILALEMSGLAEASALSVFAAQIAAFVLFDDMVEEAVFVMAVLHVPVAALMTVHWASVDRELAHRDTVVAPVVSDVADWERVVVQ